MFENKEKSLVIVHNSSTRQCAEYLSGLVGELNSSGVLINAVVVDAKKFASYPAEQKNAKQNILYIGDFSESNLVGNNINHWEFDQYGIRYGWHGNKGVIKFSHLSESDFILLAEFAEKEMTEQNLNMRANVGERGIKPLQRLKELPLLSKIALGIAAIFAPMIVAGAGVAAAMGIMVKEKGDLDPDQMRENQQKFAVLHFCIKCLPDFMGIKDDSGGE